MDMYQKRKIREEKLTKVGINWEITTYGKLLYEAINEEVVMKKIGDRYTNNIFENIKHIDEYGNEYWYARELQKVLEYKDWRNFQKVIDKAVLSANNSVSSEEDWVVEVNKPIKTGKGKEEIIKDYLSYKAPNLINNLTRTFKTRVHYFLIASLGTSVQGNQYDSYKPYSVDEPWVYILFREGLYPEAEERNTPIVEYLSRKLKQVLKLDEE